MSSQAYTPGLARKEAVVVSKTRRLPVPGEVLVNIGQKVSPETVVSRASIAGEPFMVNIAASLGIEPEETVRSLVKKIGDDVRKGEAFAQYSSFFGLSKRECKSPVDGNLEHVSRVTGQAIVRKAPIPVDVKAYIPGFVTEVIPREGVVIETPATFIQGIFGVGGEANGELMTIASSPSEELTRDQIGPQCKGKILVGGSAANIDALQRAVQVGARGVIAGVVKDKDLISLLGYDLGVAITGQEDVGLTLIITEGFGDMSMAGKTFDLLKKCSGKLACINGATQIRAGVMRPEVIVPMDGLEPKIAGEQDASQAQGLNVGTPVRVIREPFFGILGRVVALPIEPQSVESESTMRVLEVELHDGRRTTIPRANVEIIEE